MAHAGNTELVIAGLLLAIAVLVTAARILQVPYPVFLVLGGGALGFIPGMPDVTLDPEIVLLIFLPPLLYGAAFFTSLRELRRNVETISFLAIGLVLATCIAVAAIAHGVIDGLSWPAAFVLGAIVSPTDPVAATAIAGRIGVPQRIVDIVEGESLINDGTALVAYKVAIVAVVTGGFSAADAGGRFVLAAAGGVLIGMAVGYVVAWVRLRLDDPPVEITISILTGYLAYLPAEEIGASGVVAAVTVGLYMGSQTSRVTNATVRLQGEAVWQILMFLLNSLLFVLVGLQLPRILDTLPDSGVTGTQAVVYGAVVSAVVILTRLLWAFVFTYVPHWLLHPDDDAPHPANVGIVGWMGMRGAVSLAAALALPLQTDAGGEFPNRELIIFVVFVVILATLVLQGLTLPMVIRVLRVAPDDRESLREEDLARVAAARAALERLDSLEGADWIRPKTLERTRGLYDYRHRRFATRADDEIDDDRYEHRTAAWVRLTQELIEAQRDAIEELRRDGTISDDVMRRLERELDLEEQRLQL
jgi:CPA1 family monovalent cation:H+ antiporter